VFKAVVFLYFVATIAIGLYLSKRVKKASDFLVAGRQLGLPLTTATLAAIQLGAGSGVYQVDILYPNPEMEKPPIVLYPGECWYGGCCMAICPKPGAIEMRVPLANRVHWKPK